MTRTDVEAATEDRFGLWFRFRSLMIFNLLYLAGPAQLDRHNDPRAAVEQEYERRRDLHRARHGKPPVTKKVSANEGVDPVVLCAVGGVLAVVALFVWALASR